MSRRARRNHTPAFKSKVALAAVKGDRTLAQLAEQFDVHPKSDYLVEGAAWERSCRCVRSWWRLDGTASDRREVGACQDR